jgi:hypothetical protein
VGGHLSVLWVTDNIDNYFNCTKKLCYKVGRNWVVGNCYILQGMSLLFDNYYPSSYLVLVLSSLDFR